MKPKIDKRRKHQHWKVTVVYNDGEKFSRTYIDKGKADRFASRSRKCPVVASANVEEVNSEKVAQKYKK